MAKVRKIRTTAWEQEVDDGDGFHPQIALGIAKGAGAWALVTDEVTYHVEEDGETWQVAPRRPETAPPTAGEELVEATDGDSYGPALRERNELGTGGEG